MSKPKSAALLAAIAEFKVEERIKPPSAVIVKIIDDFCREGTFGDYLAHHREDALRYLPRPGDHQRTVRWRASSAGTCPQRQAYQVLFEELAAHPEATVAPEKVAGWIDAVPDFDSAIRSRLDAFRKPTQRRALYNGTFMHIRYHLMFDALHDRGLLETVTAEEQRTDPKYGVSGTVDRIVRLDYDGKALQFIIDFKSIASRFYTDLTYVPTDGYSLQVGTYFLLGFPCDWGMLLYENKDSHAIKIIDIPKSELITRMLQDTFTLMTTWVQQMYAGKRIGQRVKLPINTEWCSTCPFDKLCRVEHPERVDDILKGLPDDSVF